jgi:hypothetical protein
MLPTIKTIALSVLSLSLGVFFQTAPRPGLLKVTSVPPGASVTINGKPMEGKTNATFVVTPGQYTVTAISGYKNLNCQPTPAQVNSGQTTQVVCQESASKQ